MNALEKHLGGQQESAAALEAIARCLRAICTRKDGLSGVLVVDLCELAVSISSELNTALDAVNLPKGVLA